MESQSFFSGLFDFSFREYVTPKIIRVIFVILLVFAALGALAILVTSARGGGFGLVLGIIFAVVGFFLYVILFRIYLEVVSALFRINDNIATLVQLNGGTPMVAPTGPVRRSHHRPPPRHHRPPPRLRHRPRASCPRVRSTSRLRRSDQRSKRRNRSELVTTETLDSAMAAAAIIGSSRPNAARGMAATL